MKLGLETGVTGMTAWAREC